LAAALGYGWRQQQERLRSARVAQETADFLNWMIQSSRPMYGGRQEMPVRELVQKAGAEVGRRRDLSDPAATALLLSLGTYLTEAGDADGALRMMQEADRRASGAASQLAAKLALASLDMGQGRCTEALALARQADELATSQDLPAAARVNYLASRSELMGACEGKTSEIAAFLQPLPQLVRQIPENARDVPMRVGLYQALALNSYAVALYRARRHDEARAMVNEALRYAGQGPDSPGVRVALLRTISFIEGGLGRSRESAAALGEAVALSEGFTSPFEFLRLKVMWATKLGLAGERERPAAIARETILETHRRAAEIGPQRWMILSDAGMALLRSGDCTGVPELMREVDAIAGPSLPVQWRGNRLYTEGLCLVRLGQPELGKPRVREALAVLAPLFTPGSQLKKELEEALR
jgi:tetratricopeptide (TPR) repeat protein